MRGLWSLVVKEHVLHLSERAAQNGDRRAARVQFSQKNAENIFV
jgi:hypothetical protein